MDFNSNSNERFRKSVLITVTDMEQIISTVDEETILLGQTVYQSGTSIKAKEYCHVISHKGLYRADASISFIPSMEGELTARLLLDGKMLPASSFKLSVQPNRYYTFGISVPAFDRAIAPSENPRLELTIAGVTGIVSHAMLSTTKLA